MVTPFFWGPADFSLTAVRGQSLASHFPLSKPPEKSQAVPLTKIPDCPKTRKSQPNLKHPLNLTCQSSPHLNHLNHLNILLHQPQIIHQPFTKSPRLAMTEPLERSDRRLFFAVLFAHGYARVLSKLASAPLERVKAPSH